MVRRRGFTLIELLVFVAIFTVVVGVFVSILVVMVSVQSQQSVSSEVSQQGQYLLQQIQYEVQNAQLVDMPLDTSQGLLRLKESSASASPTLIYTPPSYVQSADLEQWAVASGTATFPKNVTANDVLAVAVLSETPTSTLSSITDDCGTGSSSDVYTIVGSPLEGNRFSMILAYAVAGATGPCTITATFASAPSEIEVMGDEISGVNTVSPLYNDQYSLNYQSANGGTTDSVTSGNIVAQQGDYIFGVTKNGENDSSMTIAAGTGFTLRQTDADVTGATEGAVQTGSPNIAAATFTNNTNWASFLTGAMVFQPGGTNVPGAGRVYVQQGIGGAPQALTSNRVTVSNLTFTRHYNLNSTSSPTGIESVAYSFTVSAGVGVHAYSQTFQSSANVTSPVPQIALLQQAKMEDTNSAVSTLSLAYPGGNEKGDLLLATVGTANAVTSSMTDTAGNTWSLVESTTTFGGQVSIFAAPNASSSAVNTTTVTFGGGGATDPTVMLFEYRGAATSSPLDAWGAQAQPDNAAPASPLVSPTSSVELLFGVDANAYPTTAVPSPGAGFTLEASSTSGYTTQLFAEDQDQYITGLVSAPWSFSVPVSSTAMIATFK